MNQKKTILFLSFFVFFQTLFSQEITIPYRDGSKWGFCNEAGEIVIAPQFDSYEFPNLYTSSASYDYIYTKKTI